MKKILLTLVTGLLLLACNNSEKATTEPAKNTELLSENLKGKVQRTTDTPYQVDSTGKTGAIDSCCIETHEYDNKGYSPSYQKKDSKGVVTEEGIATHHENGQFKGITVMDRGKKKLSVAVEVDKDGKYVSGTSYDSTGKLDGYYTDLTDNGYGGVSEGKQFNADSSLKYHWKSNYRNALYMGGVTDSAGREIYRDNVKRNDKGDQEEITSVTVYVSPTTKKDSVVTETKSFKYDSYDEQGNWTQRTEYNDKAKAVKVMKRELTYYKKE